MKASNPARAVIATALALSCAIGLAGCGGAAPAATVNGTPVAEETVAAYIDDFRATSSLEDDGAWATWLADNGYTTIVMADLIAYVRDGTPLPEKPIILSFDDGYYNNYVYVLPLLQQYSARIVLSLLGRNTDDFTEWPSESIDYAHVTWDQLNEMLDTGLVEVQNHSYNLHAYTSERHGCIQNPGESDAAYTQLLRADLQRLQDELAEHTGRTPDTFAYPYGKYGDLTDTVLRDMGFQATLTCDWGVNHITRDPDCLYRLGRICRSHNRSLQSVLQRAMKASG